VGILQRTERAVQGWCNSVRYHARFSPVNVGATGDGTPESVKSQPCSRQFDFLPPPLSSFLTVTKVQSLPFWHCPFVFSKTATSHRPHPALFSDKSSYC